MIGLCPMRAGLSAETVANMGYSYFWGRRLSYFWRGMGSACRLYVEIRAATFVTAGLTCLETPPEVDFRIVRSTDDPARPAKASQQGTVSRPHPFHVAAHGRSSPAPRPSPLGQPPSNITPLPRSKCRNLEQVPSLPIESSRMTILTDHPWLRRDTLFAATDSGVLISNASVGFEISGRGAYELFRTLHPLFDGSLELRKIRDSVPDKTWQLIERFVEPLVAQGFLRWIPASDFTVLDESTRAAFCDQIAFLAQFCDTPHRSFAGFHGARILAIGGTPLMSGLVENLRDNGARCVAHHASRTSPGAHDFGDEHGEYDLVVLGPDALSCLDDPWPLGTPVMALCASGDRLWALPTAWRPSDASWQDADRALATGLQGSIWTEAMASARSGTPQWSTATGSEAVQRLFGALTAYEIFKGLTGAMEPETSTKAISFDCFTAETATHRILSSPAAWGKPDRYVQRPTGHLGARSFDQNDSRAAQYDSDWAPLVDAFSLPASAFDDLELEQSPIKVSRLRTPTGVVNTASAWTTADARIDAIALAYANAVHERLFDDGESPARMPRGASRTSRAPGDEDGAGPYAMIGDAAVDDVAVGVDTDPEEAARRAVEALAARMVLNHQLAGVPVRLGPAGRLGTFVSKLAGERVGFLDMGTMGGFAIAGARDERDPDQICVSADASLEAAQCRAGIAVLGRIQVDAAEPAQAANPEEPPVSPTPSEPAEPAALLDVERPGGPDVRGITVSLQTVDVPACTGAGLTVVIAVATASGSREEAPREPSELVGVHGR